MPKPPSKGSYALISLGCPKNLIDTERMAGLLQLDGYRLVKEPTGADFVVINTCGFIADARDESHRAIEEMLELKAEGPNSRGDRHRLPGRTRKRSADAKISANRPIGRSVRPR